MIGAKTNLLITKLVTASFCAFLSAQVLSQQLPRITQFAEAEVQIVLDGFVDETVSFILKVASTSESSIINLERQSFHDYKLGIRRRSMW